MTSEDLTINTPSPPTFDVLPLSRELRQALEQLGYTHPTPVQREVFEPASRGRDLVVQARTGTGKTAAFGMPVVDALVQRSLAAVQVLILCPTRELALQVYREIDALGSHRGVRAVAVYGGAPMGRQVEELAAGAQVLAATPGRVLDHLRRGSLDPRSIRVLVLDESDEMLSMGFLPQINEILGYLPNPHQTLLFSATLPPDIQRLAETRLKDPLFLTLSGDQIGALDIQHLVYLTAGDKLKAFTQVIEVENPESAIVFCNTRDETKRVAAALERLGYAADWLNADLAQNEREKVMAATRNSELRFLVCTDVAARGIDISHLTHVINYDLPESPESYVHRTGRTGRAGRTGTAISLIEPSDIGNLYMLRLVYKIFPVEKQLPSAGELRTRQELDVVEMFAQAFERRQIHQDDLSLARRLMTHEAAERIIACLLRDHLGARPEATREATEARRAKAPNNSERGPERNGSGNRTSAEPVPNAARRDSGDPRGARPRPAARSADARERSAPVNPSFRDDNPRGYESRPDRRSRRDSRTNDPSTNNDSRDSRNNDARENLVGAANDGQNRPYRDDSRDARDSRNSDARDSRNSDARDSRNSNARESRNSDARESRNSDARESRNSDARENVAKGAGPGQIRTYRDDDFEFGYSVEEVPSEPVTSTTNDVPQQASVPPAAPKEPTLELFVSVGRVDGAKEEDLYRILEALPVARLDAVRISLRRNHSFVRVHPDDFTAAATALNGATIAGKAVVAEQSRSSRA